jgi:hemerythrin superfamily protein
MTNAIELLEQDHRNVRKLLEELSETSEKDEKKRNELLDRIEHELTLHTTLEEEIFYPAFREAGEKKKDDQKMYYEAREEHRAVEKLVMPDLKKTKTTTVEFAGRVKVLKELIEHHVEEEEQEMFPEANKLMTKKQLEELGERIQARKKELSKAA